ncbi:MAG: phospholipase D-like domain-containing protein [Acidimicrobiales bacterium]|jgi:phosphatidylserine/phosphatidylglycerophosphate/cardiolipin synthase-like enzyme
MSLKGSLRRVGVALLVTAMTVGLVASAGASPGTAPSRTATTAGLTSVIVEPSRLGSAAGMAPIYRFVLSAKKSVDMTMYELVDPTMVADLIKDRRRGVKVRVILDTNRERSHDLAAFDALKAGGVKVAWANTIYEATHQKTITVDGVESLILTGNLTAEYYTTTRDFGVFDTNPKDVKAIEAVFGADFAHKAVKPSDGADLVWSPGSQAQILAVINGAHHTLSIENEEMADSAITRALVAAAKRKVTVEVTMTADSAYDSDWAAIVKAGGHVHLYADSSSVLYIHAKAIVADAGSSHKKAYVGSINFSSASMNRNRELGVITTNARIVDELNAVLTKDYSDCTPATGCKNYR